MRGQSLRRSESSSQALFRRACAIVVAVAAWVGAPARAETIDFTELPLNTVANGAKVKGVTFGYTVNNVASQDARFTATGPGLTTITTPPNLEAGTAGVLSLDFATPVTGFGFAYIASTPTANPNGLTVTLTDPKGGMVSKQLAIDRIGNFAGVRFDDPSLTPVARVVIDPSFPVGGRFVVDNVTFTPIPEPTGLLALAGSAAVLLARRRCR